MKEKKYLGDHVADLIYFLMPRISDWFHGQGCGCDGRQKKLNEFHKRIIRIFKKEENEQNQL